MTRRKITSDTCRTCGLCCVGGDEGQGWADCTDRDVERMSPRVRAQLVEIREYGLAFSDAWCSTPTRFTDDFGGVCEFLRGTPGVRVSCRIYATRPDVCRDYKPGSRECRFERTKFVK